METCKNRRTLKKRIRRVISICVLITIILLGTFVLILAAGVFKGQAVFWSEYFSNSIAESMNSEYFNEQMGISGLESFDSNSPSALKWLDSIRASQTNITLPTFKKEITRKIDTEIANKHAIGAKTGNSSVMIKLPDIFNPGTVIDTTITLNGKHIFPAKADPGAVQPVPGSRENPDSMVQKLKRYFMTESKTGLYSSTGEEIGNVTVGISPDLSTAQFIGIAVVIVLAAVLVWLAVKIAAWLFTIPVTIPLNKLEKAIRAAAAGDYEAMYNSQISVKKPLREIEGLADSTNLIMNRMKEYNDRLSEQNNELEAQNEELAVSKKKVEEAQTLLVQTENMASIGQLTAAITHEINTPLGAINSNVQLCDMLIGILLSNGAVISDGELSDIINQMKEANNISVMACKRVNEIIKSLKSFSKIDQAEFQEADMSENLRSVLVLTSNLWKNRIAIHEEYGSLPLVRCYPGLLNQVFMNLIVNAIQAVEDKGDIFIKTFIDEKNAYVSIRDTGGGISREDLPRIFDAGFSTKGAGIGMGLGLSICSNIVQKHLGEIKVNSEQGKGTEFVVSIPLNLG